MLVDKKRYLLREEEDALAEKYCSECQKPFCAFCDTEVEDADAVPVVRCKDCKHRQKDTIFKKLYCDGREVVADGFCEKGERDETD